MSQGDLGPLGFRAFRVLRGFCLGGGSDFRQGGEGFCGVWAFRSLDFTHEGSESCGALNASKHENKADSYAVSATSSAPQARQSRWE